MLTHVLPYEPAPAKANQLLRLTNSPINQVSGGQASMTNNARPTTVSDYMLFTGTQAVRFANNGNNWHVTAPYSVEMEVFIDAFATKWIATLGEGFGAGWPEWTFMHNDSNIVLTSSNTNNGYSVNQVLVQGYMPQRWYRIGFMFYVSEGTNYVSGYVNGTPVFTTVAPVPYTTANGLSIGSDWSYNTSAGATARIFKGRIRNVIIARSTFWTL